MADRERARIVFSRKEKLLVKMNVSPNSIAWLTTWRKSPRRNSPFACSDLCSSRGAERIALRNSLLRPVNCADVDLLEIANTAGSGSLLDGGHAGLTGPDRACLRPFHAKLSRSPFAVALLVDGAERPGFNANRALWTFTHTAPHESLLHCGQMGNFLSLSVEGCALEQWLRRRLRSAIWKQWKRGPARFAELRRRGVNADLAAQTAGSDHGPWRLADSPALSIALPNAYFDSLGIPRLTVKPIA